MSRVPSQHVAKVVDALAVAFDDLRKQGYKARQNFMCCQTCGSASLRGKGLGYVFYHNQDMDRLNAGGGTYLAYDGDGMVIVKALLKAGLRVQWNTEENERIYVDMEQEGES